MVWYRIRIFPWLVEVGEESASEEGGAVKRAKKRMRKSGGLDGEYGSAVVP